MWGDNNEWSTTMSNSSASKQNSTTARQAAASVVEVVAPALAENHPDVENSTTARQAFAVIKNDRDLSTQALLEDIAEEDETVRVLSIALQDGDGYDTWERGVSERSIYNTAKKIIDTAAELNAMGLVVEAEQGWGAGYLCLRSRDEKPKHLRSCDEKTGYIARIVYSYSSQMSHLACRKICDQFLEAAHKYQAAIDTKKSGE